MSGKDGSVCENYACMYYYRLATNTYPHSFRFFSLGPLALLELWDFGRLKLGGVCVTVRARVCVRVCILPSIINVPASPQSLVRKLCFDVNRMPR